MSSSRERYKRKKEKKRVNFNFRLGKVIPFLLLFSFLGYCIYVYIGFSKIKNEDPLKEGNSNYYLLSDKKDALEKTLIIFEQEYNEREVIKYVFMYAENKEKGISVLTYIPSWVEYKGLEKDFGTSVFVSAFKHAGEFIQDGRGTEYAIWQIEQLLGSNIDEYIWFSASSSKLLQEKLGEPETDAVYAQYYSNGFETSQEAFFLNSFISKLSWFNLVMSSSKFKDSQAVIYSSYPTLANTVVELKDIQKSILSTRPYLIDLGNPRFIIQEENQGNVGMSNYINISEYDLVWRDFIDSMIDRDLEKERARIEVYNASGLSGYAAQYARRVRNSGVEVVRYDNAPQLEANTKFYIPNLQDYPVSYQIIQEIFPGQHEVIDGRPSFMTTGDIVIILGEDIPTLYSF